MNKPIIEVRNLSKKYTFGERQPYYSFRDTISSIFHTPFRREKLEKDEFWALKDVSFDVNEGDVVGVIGRNGAGKSTLLKILSQITPPTEGEVKLRGRVASLLEVGTGFHPELTGRENIYLNGAILGMKRWEINKKFKEIVEFAEIEKFLDTPVKHYSSGMYMRLAFAVAAHLEPEILLVDEVLAVGDAQFQKKCLGKMSDVSKQGRTVIFVSHNMEAVSRLCKKVIVFNNGLVEYYGETETGISRYLNSGQKSRSTADLSKELLPTRDYRVKLLHVYVHDAQYVNRDVFDITKKIGITMKYGVLKEGCIFTHGINLYNDNKINVFNSHDTTSPKRNLPRSVGIHTATAWIPENFLSEGTYSVGVALLRQEPFEIFLHFLDIVVFSVEDKITGKSARGEYVGGFPGVVRPLLDWDIKTMKANDKK